MRTLILSDIHLGNGGDYDIFAGEDALPALLDEFAAKPTRVVLNGDSADFLMNQDPLELEPKRAVRQAEAIAEAQATRRTLLALGKILANGGELVVRLGNHDIELALRSVQDVFRKSLGQPESVTAKVRFERGATPKILEVGGARVLITHGEQDDPFNMVNYAELTDSGAGFRYPPGSRLVKEILNPLKKDYGMRFADLLKPDFQGAALTALAVDPAATRVVFQKSTLDIGKEVIAKLGEKSFVDEGDELGLGGLLDRAGLSYDEAEALAMELTEGEKAYDLADFLASARNKLARSGLELYARAHRFVAGGSSADFFEFETPKAELEEAERLATKFDVDSVITGHSHAARFHDEGVVYLNTGTWIWLLRLPEPTATKSEWADFLTDLRNDPGMKTQKNRDRLEKRFTPVTIEESSTGGARVTMNLWEPSGKLTEVASAFVAARP